MREKERWGGALTKQRSGATREGRVSDCVLRPRSPPSSFYFCSPLFLNSAHEVRGRSVCCTGVSETSPSVPPCLKEWAAPRPETPRFLPLKICEDAHAYTNSKHVFPERHTSTYF